MATNFEREEELVVGLYDSGALQFSDFEWTLKSGRKSPIYYNQRPALSFTTNSNESFVSTRKRLSDRSRIVDAYVDAVSGGPATSHLYGIPQAMTALGAVVACETGSSYLWGRAGDKAYGQHSKVEGNFVEGDSILQLDDVITDAGSKIESAEGLQASGLETYGFVVMFDREEGGEATLRAADYHLISITGLSRAMPILLENNRIGAQETEWVARYHEGLASEGIASTYQPSW